MTETQIDSLQIILNNDTILSALRQVFEDTLSTSLPLVDGTIANEVIGERYRAYVQASNIIWSAFLTLDNYRKNTTKEIIDEKHI